MGTTTQIPKARHRSEDTHARSSDRCPAEEGKAAEFTNSGEREESRANMVRRRRIMQEGSLLARDNG